MPPQHMRYEFFRNAGVAASGFPFAQHDIIHDRECRHKFRTRSLRQQWAIRIGYFHY